MLYQDIEPICPLTAGEHGRGSTDQSSSGLLSMCGGRLDIGEFPDRRPASGPDVPVRGRAVVRCSLPVVAIRIQLPLRAWEKGGTLERSKVSACPTCKLEYFCYPRKALPYRVTISSSRPSRSQPSARTPYTWKSGLRAFHYRWFLSSLQTCSLPTDSRAITFPSPWSWFVASYMDFA